MVKEGRKKLNELPKTVKSVDSSLDLQNNVYMSGYQDTKNSLSSSPLEFFENLTSIVPASSSLGLTDFVSSITNSISHTEQGLDQTSKDDIPLHCKFGEFGILEGQFTEASGVAVTEENEIIVADTNNHRIQAFDKEGNFKFQFGEVGKRDGQLLYPVVAKTGDIFVTETHQVDNVNIIYESLREGFIRKKKL